METQEQEIPKLKPEIQNLGPEAGEKTEVENENKLHKEPAADQIPSSKDYKEPSGVGVVNDSSKNGGSEKEASIENS